MSKKKEYSRFDILSLDFRKIKNIIRPEKCTKLAVSVNGIDIQNIDPSVTPWVYASPYNIPLTRNKIGKTLLKQQRNKFLLNDPHMNQSRFFVDYHRLQDPALKRYFQSVPVRKQLEVLGLVTKDNNALCSVKDFAEYIRYLERLRSLEIADSIGSTIKRRVSENLKKVADTKQYESQFTGIFRRKKYKINRKTRSKSIKEVQNVSTNNLYELQSDNSQSPSRNKSRAEQIKKENRNRCRQHQSKKDKIITNKQMRIQKENIRKIEAAKKLEYKLQQAELRKKRIYEEKLMAKFSEGVEYFKKHWIFREQARIKTNKLYEMYEEEKRKNIQKREMHLEKLHEYDEMKKIVVRHEMMRKERNEEIIKKMTKQVQVLSKKYLKQVDPKDFDEISRRFSMLTEQFILNCLKRMDETLHNLKILVSAATLVDRLISVMKQMVVLDPDIGPSKCALVRKRVAGFIAQTITQITNERFNNIIESWQRKNDKLEHSILLDTTKRSSERHVSIDDNAIQDLNENSSFDEFIGEMKTVVMRKTEKTYNLNKIVSIGMTNLFDMISKRELCYSDRFNYRDFIHLYDFQKYFLHKSIKRITELVKCKQQHYWNYHCVDQWKNLNMNLEEISFETIDMILNYPWKDELLCGCVRKIAKYICVEISKQLAKENIHLDPDDVCSKD